MLFLWVPLYCTGTCVYTPLPTLTLHTQFTQLPITVSVSFSACFLSKLCTFYGFHFTVQALVSAPPRTLTLHTLFKPLHAYQYHSLQFHFTVQALVSAPPPTLHTQFMQLPISINYHFLLVCCFYLCYFYGCHFIVQTLVSAPPLTLHIQFQQLLFLSLPACTYTCKRQFHRSF